MVSDTLLCIQIPQQQKSAATKIDETGVRNREWSSTSICRAFLFSEAHHKKCSDQ
jgi:hypothetical protein